MPEEPDAVEALAATEDEQAPEKHQLHHIQETNSVPAGPGEGASRLERALKERDQQKLGAKPKATPKAKAKSKAAPKAKATPKKPAKKTIGKSLKPSSSSKKADSSKKTVKKTSKPKKTEGGMKGTQKKKNSVEDDQEGHLQSGIPPDEKLLG